MLDEYVNKVFFCLLSKIEIKFIKTTRKKKSLSFINLICNWSQALSNNTKFPPIFRRLKKKYYLIEQKRCVFHHQMEKSVDGLCVAKYKQNLTQFVDRHFVELFLELHFIRLCFLLYLCSACTEGVCFCLCYVYTIHT